MYVFYSETRGNILYLLVFMRVVYVNDHRLIPTLRAVNIHAVMPKRRSVR